MRHGFVALGLAVLLTTTTAQATPTKLIGLYSAVQPVCPNLIDAAQLANGAMCSSEGQGVACLAISGPNRGPGTNFFYQPDPLAYQYGYLPPYLVNSSSVSASCDGIPEYVACVYCNTGSVAVPPTLNVGVSSASQCVHYPVVYTPTPW